MELKSGLKAGQCFNSLILFSLINCYVVSLICADSLSLIKISYL